MKKTALYDAHLEAGAKIVEFAGYAMPVQYSDGILKEHLQVRENAGLFDVSHMGQALITGAGAVEFAEKTTPSKFSTLEPNTAKYTVLLNDNNGIVDDLIITKISDDKLFIVYNAGCKEKDEDFITKQLQQFNSAHLAPSTAHPELVLGSPDKTPDQARGVQFTALRDRALIAIQGQRAEEILSSVINGVTYENHKYMTLAEVDCPVYGHLYISRLGYTGEDGFEISISNDKATAFWNKLQQFNIKPIGLGARDSLRLEMGYPLYGHDINDETTPIEANLQWIMPKAKREEFDAPKNIRVGFEILDRSILREGVEVFSTDGKKIGAITSGGFSPTLQKPIAQGYVESACATIGTDVNFELRGRKIAGKIAPISFIKPKTKSAK